MQFTDLIETASNKSKITSARKQFCSEMDITGHKLVISVNFINREYLSATTYVSACRTTSTIVKVAVKMI